jgi:hypothetical protein
MKMTVIFLSAILILAFSTASVQAIDIRQGWNMVSFKIDYANITKCVNVNSYVDQYSSLSSLYNYNPSTNSYDVLTLKNMYNSVVRGKGFWIYKSSQGACNIEFKGATATNPTLSINLKKGWNQISDGFDAAINGGPSIEDYKGNCNILSGPWQYSNAQNSYIISSILSWFDGFWVYVDKDCTLQKTCAAQGGTCATYSATFSQTGIPAATPAAATYSSASSSITVSGLSGTASYSYTTTLSGASGTRYSCSTGCSGSVTASATSASASYSKQYQLIIAPNPTNGGATSTALGWYNSGSIVQISATAASGYTFSSWTGSGTGSYSGTSSSASITMNGPITETANFAVTGGAATCSSTLCERANPLGCRCGTAYSTDGNYVFCAVNTACPSGRTFDTQAACKSACNLV